MQPILVSILIPTYNQQQYISKAVESALAQTYHSIEIIVADDHGTDETAEIVASYASKDARLRYVRNEKNLGRVANYRKALYNLAKGDYVVMLDGDDYLLNEKFIELSVSAIQQEKELVLFVKCAHAKFKTWLNKPAPIETNKQFNFEKTSAGYYLKEIGHFGFNHFGILYNRQMALKADFYSRDIFASDMDSFFRLCLQHPDEIVLVGNLIAGVWVKHNQNASSLVDDWRNYADSNVRIFYNVMKNPVGSALGIGWVWVIKRSTKPILAYILRKIGFRF